MIFRAGLKKMSSPIDPGTEGLADQRTRRAITRARYAPLLGLVAGLVGLGVVGAFLTQSIFINPDPPKVNASATPPKVEKVVSGQASKITGFDKNKQPFELSALNGTQDTINLDLVHLQTVTGTFHRADGGDVIGPAAGAGRLVAQVGVGADEVRIDRGVAALLVLLERPLDLGILHLLEIGDANAAAAGFAVAEEVRDGDGRDEADDGHDDHDFDEGEAPPAVSAVQFHTCVWLFCDVVCFLCFSVWRLNPTNAHRAVFTRAVSRRCS